MDAERYLDRIDIDPDTVSDPNLDALARLQRAHLRTVPFETLAITGDPFGNSDGDGVSLAEADLYEKVVENGRGGFCYELNGAFTWLLREIGFDAARYPGRMLVGDGVTLPANHLVPVVTLDRSYVVDVGMGAPKIRRPVPLDGTPVTDETGLEWRVAESDRPDVDHRTQYREAGAEVTDSNSTDADGEDWNDRYVFTAEPREMTYFEATCDYLQSAPESGFTDGPSLVVARDGGDVKLSGRTLTRTVGDRETERTLEEAEWYEVVGEEFGIDWPRD